MLAVIFMLTEQYITIKNLILFFKHDTRSKRNGNVI